MMQEFWKNSESSSPEDETLRSYDYLSGCWLGQTLSGEIWVFLTKNPTSSHPIIIISLDGDVWKTWKIIKVHLTEANLWTSDYQFGCWHEETQNKFKCFFLQLKPASCQLPILMLAKGNSGKVQVLLIKNWTYSRLIIITSSELLTQEIVKTKKQSPN